MATVTQLVDQAENALDRAKYALKEYNTPEMRDLVGEAERYASSLRKAVKNRDWGAIALFSARVVDLACRAAAVAGIRQPWYTQAVCMGTAAGLGIHKRIVGEREEKTREALRRSVQRHRR